MTRRRGTPRALRLATGLSIVLAIMSLMVTPASAVTVFSDDMEGGTNGWTAIGFWHQVSNPQTVQVFNQGGAAPNCPANDINPDLVTLPDTNAQGQAFLLPAFSGSTVWWFGVNANGTFIGAFPNAVVQGCKGGGIGGPNGGTLTSPVISLAGLSSATLQFKTWFEIESVDAPSFDVMTVQILNASGDVLSSIRLNPEFDANGFPDQPFSSGGFNVAPVWVERGLNLTGFVGQNIRIRFSFDTGDVLYNGFRGWAIDDVVVEGVGANQAPTALNDSYSVDEDHTLTVVAPGVLGNDADPDGPAPLMAVLEGTTSHGTLSLNADGSFTYTPQENFFGTDSFTYKAKDGLGAVSGPATVTITVNAVDDAPSFTFATEAANPIVTVNEDSGAVSVAWVTNISAGPGEAQALTFIVTTDNPGLFSVQPAIAPDGSLTFKPAPNANGIALVTVTLRDSGGKTFARTFTVNVTAENDPPTFDAIADQTVVKPEPVSITGVLAGPPTATDETEDVTVTATVETSDPTSLITNLTVTPAIGKDATRILTYERGTQQAGRATIKVTATDAGGLSSEPRTFAIELGTGELANAVANSSPPTSSAGFSNEPIILTATFTFPPIDWNGDGQFTDPQDCYFVVLPRGRKLYNVIPFLEGLKVRSIPEAVPTTLGGPDTARVCTEPLTVTTEVRVDDWYDVPEGPTEYTLRYVAFVRDPDIRNGTCVVGSDGCFDRIVQGTAETSGVLQRGDQCPNSGPPFGAGAGGTGCNAAVRNTVQIHTVNLGGGASRKAPAVGAQVRVFDRNSADFQKVAGSKNPNGSLYGVIIKAAEANLAVGQVGVCFTTATGQCFAGVENPGDYLVIVTVVYEVTIIENGTTKNKFVTVYVGRPLSPSDFVGGIATKEFQVIKVLKNGIYQETRGGSKVVVTGSILEVIVPESAIWDGTQSIYPFIFTSDSSWTVDVCAQVPAGYQVVGVYDENANLIGTSDCAQTLVANQEKVIAFEVMETGSPEPSLAATLTVRGPNGKSQVKHLTASDIRRHTFNDKVHEAKAKGTKKKKQQNLNHSH